MTNIAEKQPVLEPITIGELQLSNRVVMAPMTRGRATNEGMVPEPIQSIYYGQRASAGLIISEGTWVNQYSIGYGNVPGIFTPEQTEGWKGITQAVHEKGGKIFSQLGHAGALSHPDFLNGEQPVGPSAVNPNFPAYTPKGPQQTVEPRALTIAEIKQTIQAYKEAAQNAKAAGFDGLELHVQHPSLISQFLSDHLNRRTDEYGGSLENKSRLLFEILDAVTAVWGAKRVSIKINPYLSYSGAPGHVEDSLTTYSFVVERLNQYDLAFLHILNMPDPSTTAEELAERDVFGYFRAIYHGRIIASGGFNQEKANELIGRKVADLVSFGTLFIPNPDLPVRFERNLPLNEGDPNTYVFGGEKGYIDYAFVDHTAEEEA